MRDHTAPDTAPSRAPQAAADVVAAAPVPDAGLGLRRIGADPVDPTGAEPEAAAQARRTPYAVWAPHAQTVELVLVDAVPGSRHDAQDRWAGARAVAMDRAAGGWWTPSQDPAAVLGAPAPADPGYGYRVDGGDPVPDPRSRRQPDTVHGPSRRDVEGADFAWTDADWRGPAGVLADPAAPQGGGLRGAVLYELHVGTFTAEGTLEAAIERLPHLVELGVTHLELLPVNSFNGPRNWGYDGVAWFAVDESYGGPQAYRRFVDAAHAAGLGVVQDVVYNHLGPAGNYLGAFGPYLTAGDTGWGEGVNLDGPDSDEVRRHILDNVRMWIEEFHVDGLRLDAVHALRDTRAVHLLEEMAALADEAAARAGRPVPLMAESDLNDPRLVLPRSAGGLGLAAAWNDDVHHALHVATTGETGGYYADFAPLEAVAKVMERAYFHDGTRSTFRGRDHGRPVPADVPNEAFIVSIQNHDQVGNRAAGDRTGATLSEGSLAAEAALLLTGPNVPLLFMGEEFAASTPWAFFTSFPDEDLGEAVRQGRRREFAAHGWDPADVPDPQDRVTRDSAVLDWAEPGQGRGARVQETYRRLIGLRRTLPALTEPRRSLTRAWVDPERRHVRLERGRAEQAACGDVVLLAALGDLPLTVPEDLRGAHVLAGHTDAGPLAADADAPAAAPVEVAAPGFLLLQR
ncbi:malto-oligosyltrehalose trehalohydrolase [Micrococcus sp. M4NT]|uniref:malto-oligosyltrehalose trehalohydrolase n=1 Tax=Micrococcus sp. M4NT TaxID=2957501 RepID=UPI0029ABDD5D|nr:malto-oligosyltrehalose trehalohydrolase [Micrococcus sp. M4NT]MDX2342129.1 malto-oligosyltrehalose trehalohydrolase [Micrococcus sp. M4NT]